MHYRGDEDLQALLLGADVLGRVDHGPCGAATVQLGGGDTTTTTSSVPLVAIQTPRR
jgi:hypothetical protein